MLAIIADNTKNLKNSAPKKPGTFKTRRDAQAAAVRTIGPQAREGFEYATSKCDGVWIWLEIGVEDRKPETEAQLKANGGKRSVLSLPAGAAAAYAAAELKNSKNSDGLDIPEFLRRTPDKRSEDVVPAPSVAANIMIASAVAPVSTGTTVKELPKGLTEDGRDSHGQKKSRGRSHLYTFDNGCTMWMTAKELETQKALETERDRLTETLVAKTESETKDMTKKTTTHAPKERKDGLKVGSKSAILVDTVCRKGGATNEQLCEAVGWAQCLPALQKAAAKAGVTITTKKEPGKKTIYIGIRAVA